MTKAANLDFGFKGTYESIEIIGVDGKVRQTHKQDNILTDLFFSYMAASNTAVNMAYCYISTSTATPNVSTTTMPNLVAAHGTKDSSVVATSGSGTDWYTENTWVWTFPVNAYVGTFTALGAGGNSGATTLMSWVRLLDGGGNPTSLTLLTGEQLRVTYNVKMKRPNTQATGTVILDGVTYNYTISPCDITKTTAGWWQVGPSQLFPANLWTAATPYNTITLSSVTAAPVLTGALTQFTNSSISNTPPNFYADVTMLATTAQGNGSIGGIVNTPGGINIYVMIFSPQIPKTNTKTLTLVVRVTYSRI